MTDAELTELYNSLPIERQSRVYLYMRALARQNYAVADAMGALIQAPEDDAAPFAAEPDYDLAESLGRVCDDRERVHWGRVIVHAKLRGDRRAFDELHRIARLRVAS